MSESHLPESCGNSARKVVGYCTSFDAAYPLLPPAYPDPVGDLAYANDK